MGGYAKRTCRMPSYTIESRTMMRTMGRSATLQRASLGHPHPRTCAIEKTIPTRTTGGVVIRNHVGRYDQGSLPAGYCLPSNSTRPSQSYAPARAQRLERPGKRFGLRPGPEDRAQQQARDDHEAHPGDSCAPAVQCTRGILRIVLSHRRNITRSALGTAEIHCTISIASSNSGRYPK